MGSVLLQHRQRVKRGSAVETDPHAVAMRMFGIALRHFRTQADLSLRELGKRCHYGYSRLSRMENGEHLGDEVLVGTIDQMLHAGGLLRALRSAAQPPSVLPALPWRRFRRERCMSETVTPSWWRSECRTEGACACRCLGDSSASCLLRGPARHPPRRCAWSRRGRPPHPGNCPAQLGRSAGY